MEKRSSHFGSYRLRGCRDVCGVAFVHASTMGERQELIYPANPLTHRGGSRHVLMFDRGEQQARRAMIFPPRYA
jgi:hypothetical protein